MGETSIGPETTQKPATVQIVWEASPSIQTNLDFKAHVTNQVFAEIPLDIRNAWQLLTIPTDENGHKLEKNVRAYLKAKMEEAQVARNGKGKTTDLHLVNEDGALPIAVKYIFINSKRICVHTYALEMGNKSWEVSKGAKKATLAVEVAWATLISGGQDGESELAEVDIVTPETAPESQPS